MLNSQLKDQVDARLELKEIIGQAYISAADFKGAQSIWTQESHPTAALKMTGALSLFFQGEYEQAGNVINDIPTDVGSDLWFQKLMLKGDILKAQSKFAEAITEYRTVVGQPATNTNQKRMIIQAYVNIASSHSLNADFDNALSNIQQAEQFAENYLPGKHVGKMDLYSVYGDILAEVGKQKEAKQYYEKGYQIALTALGDKHPMTATTIRNMGVMEEYMENYPAAIDAYLKAEQSYRAHFGDEHLYVTHLWNDLGIVYRYTGEYTKSLQYLQKAQNVVEKLFGTQHADLASIIGNQGVSLYYLGRYQESYDTLQKALALDITLSGEKHYRTAIRYFWLAFVSNRLGNSTKAMDYINTSIGITHELFGESHISLVRNYRVKAQILLSQGEKDQAYQISTKGISVWESLPEKVTSEVLPLYFQKILILMLNKQNEDVADTVSAMIQLRSKKESKEYYLQQFWQAFAQGYKTNLDGIEIGENVAEKERVMLLQSLSDCATEAEIQSCTGQMNLGWIY